MSTTEGPKALRGVSSVLADESKRVHDGYLDIESESPIERSLAKRARNATPYTYYCALIKGLRRMSWDADAIRAVTDGPVFSYPLGDRRAEDWWRLQRDLIADATVGQSSYGQIMHALRGCIVEACHMGYMNHDELVEIEQIPRAMMRDRPSIRPPLTPDAIRSAFEACAHARHPARGIHDRAMLSAAYVAKQPKLSPAVKELLQLATTAIRARSESA